MQHLVDTHWKRVVELGNGAREHELTEQTMKLLYHSNLGRGLDSTLRTAQRKVDARKGFVPPGLSGRGHRKIAWEAVCLMRKQHAQGWTLDRIAAEAGCSTHRAHLIVQGEARVFR